MTTGRINQVTTSIPGDPVSAPEARRRGLPGTPEGLGRDWKSVGRSRRPTALAERLRSKSSAHPRPRVGGL